MTKDAKATALKARADKMAQVMKELKAEYLLKFPKKIALLKSMTEARDFVGLEGEYHKLKGTGKTYGFPEVSTICETLERLAIKEFSQKIEIFDQAVLFFEKLHRVYLQNKSLDLDHEPFARSLLDLTAK